jgi:hypothetical protein
MGTVPVLLVAYLRLRRALHVSLVGLCVRPVLLFHTSTWACLVAAAGQLLVQVHHDAWIC